MEVSYLTNDKFSIPTLPTVCAHRDELMQSFSDVAKKRIVYVSAPAGFGKTASTKLWLERTELNVLWISLDEYDNAPAIFFSLLCKRLLALQPDNQAMMAIFNDPSFSTSPLEHTIQLLTHYQPDQRQYALVLDDVHLITNTKIRKDFFAVQKRMPSSFTTFLLTRDDIDPIEYQQTGGDPACGRITKKQLLFSALEIKAYFQAKKHPISKKEAEMIQQVTNGWPIGINALAEAGVTQPSYSNKRFFHDYFNNYIWHTFNKELQQFLLQTSIVAKLTPTLAEKLTGRVDSQKLLDELATENFFITRYDQECYRYHQLFVDFLQDQLEQQAREHTEILYQTASDYYLAQNEIFLARGYALKSGNQATIQRVNYLLVDTSRANTNISVKEFVNAFCTYSTNTLFQQKQFPYPYLYSQFAGYYFLVGDVMMTEYCFDQIDANLPLIQEKYPQFLADTLLMTFVDSRKSIGQLLKNFLKYPRPSVLEDRLKWSTITMQLPFAHRSCRDFCQLSCILQAPTSIIKVILGKRGTSLLLLVQAGNFYERNQLDKAQRLLQKVNRLLEEEQVNDEETVFCFLMLQAALYTEQSTDPKQLNEVLSTVNGFIQSRNQTFKENLQAFETRLALYNGQQTAANTWLESYLPDDTDSLELYRIYQHLTTARALLVANHPNTATAFLAKVKTLAESFHRPTDVAETLVLQAVLAWWLNHQRKAVTMLEEALLLLQEADYLRVVAVEGAAVLPILKQLQKQLEADDKPNSLNQNFLTRTIALAENYAMAQCGIACQLRRPQVKLSKQQRRMLKLLSQGYKNAEIAEMTGLTIHTVKFHLSAAYHKLGVNSGNEAVETAQKKHLI